METKRIDLQTLAHPDALIFVMPRGSQFEAFQAAALMSLACRQCAQRGERGLYECETTTEGPVTIFNLWYPDSLQVTKTCRCKVCGKKAVIFFDLGCYHHLDEVKERLFSPKMFLVGSFNMLCRALLVVPTIILTLGSAIYGFGQKPIRRFWRKHVRYGYIGRFLEKFFNRKKEIS